MRSPDFAKRWKLFGQNASRMFKKSSRASQGSSKPSKAVVAWHIALRQENQASAPAPALYSSELCCVTCGGGHFSSESCLHYWQRLSGTTILSFPPRSELFKLILPNNLIGGNNVNQNRESRESISTKTEGMDECLVLADLSGNSLYYDQIVATSSPTLTPLGIKQLLEQVDPPPTLSIHKSNICLEVGKELKLCKAITIETSVHETSLSVVEQGTAIPYRVLHFFGGDNKLPVIIAKELDVEEKSAS
ncbi:hypothetical protein Tco_0517046 [Tanacetum coccineum]